MLLVLHNNTQVSTIIIVRPELLSSVAATLSNKGNNLTGVRMVFV